MSCFDIRTNCKELLFFKTIHACFSSLHHSLKQFIPANTQFAPSMIIFGIIIFAALRKHWLYIFYFFSLVIPVAGQQARQYSFTHYGVSTGLASNEATTGLQDEQGFIWVAGNKGLQRFDGQRYLTFGYQKKQSVCHPS